LAYGAARRPVPIPFFPIGGIDASNLKRVLQVARQVPCAGR